ncbi:MAG: hypothetical protein KME35_10370 [Aphanocapsa sp. GSE-SYN-MK-11-07L]|jgi:hypothetical protein|nr:hypothetical protein [Aphanocapsa sp. GSE-SYN-MK-11-07L]
MFNSKDSAIAKLSSRDQQLLNLIKTYPDIEDKAEKSQRVTQLLCLDKTQAILKYLSREITSQTAFSFTLWLIDAERVSLNWIYDMAYTISTNPTQHDIDLSKIYESTKKLDVLDLTIIITETEDGLAEIKLDKLNVKDLANSLDEGLALSMLTWFLTFKKVASVDLSYISEISKNINRSELPLAEKVASNQSEPVVSQAQPLSAIGEIESNKSFADYTFEDMLFALNLRLGGSEDQLLPRTLDNFLFKKVVDPNAGSEKVVFRPGLKVTKYLYDGKERQMANVNVCSTKTWPPGVYAIQKDEDEVKVTRLPGNDYFEVLPDGPDPHLRALTILSMSNADPV